MLSERAQKAKDREGMKHKGGIKWKQKKKWEKKKYETIKLPI